ncbi:hypothetical protein PRIC1_004134 [Phytophthora ramorum]
MYLSIALACKLNCNGTVFHLAQFPICVVSTTSIEVKKKPLPPHRQTATMFDQLKHVMSHPMNGKAPAEKHLGGLSPQSKLEKEDPSTAFERSGWVYI